MMKSGLDGRVNVGGVVITPGEAKELLRVITDAQVEKTLFAFLEKNRIITLDKMRAAVHNADVNAASRMEGRLEIMDFLLNGEGRSMKQFLVAGLDRLARPQKGTRPPDESHQPRKGA